MNLLVSTKPEHRIESWNALKSETKQNENIFCLVESSWICYNPLFQKTQKKTTTGKEKPCQGLYCQNIFVSGFKVNSDLELPTFLVSTALMVLLCVEDISITYLVFLKGNYMHHNSCKKTTYASYFTSKPVFFFLLDVITRV